MLIIKKKKCRYELFVPVIKQQITQSTYFPQSIHPVTCFPHCKTCKTEKSHLITEKYMRQDLQKAKGKNQRTSQLHLVPVISTPLQRSYSENGPQKNRGTTESNSLGLMSTNNWMPIAHCQNK